MNWTVEYCEEKVGTYRKIAEVTASNWKEVEDALFQLDQILPLGYYLGRREGEDRGRLYIWASRGEMKPVE